MTDSRQAFEQRFDRDLAQMSGEVRNVLELGESVEAVTRETASVIDQLCGRWTDAERERNRLRGEPGENWRHCRKDAEAAVNRLRDALSRAARLTGGLQPTRSAGAEGTEHRLDGEFAAAGGSGG